MAKTMGVAFTIHPDTIEHYAPGDPLYEQVHRLATDALRSAGVTDEPMFTEPEYVPAYWDAATQQNLGPMYVVSVTGEAPDERAV